jgi:hypothetical protein
MATITTKDGAAIFYKDGRTGRPAGRGCYAVTHNDTIYGDLKSRRRPTGLGRPLS